MIDSHHQQGHAHPGAIPERKNLQPRWRLGVLASIAILTAGGAFGGWAASETSPRAAPPVDRPAAIQAFRDRASSQAAERYFLTILTSNLAVYAWLLMGIVSGGLTTVAILTFNGILIGQAAVVATQLGASGITLALLSLPHGVPELAAFVLASAVGLQGPALIRAWLRHANGTELLRSLWRPALLGLPLLAAAAGIEVRVTLPLALSVEDY